MQLTEPDDNRAHVAETVDAPEWALRASTFLVPIEIPEMRTVSGMLRGTFRHGLKLSRLSASGHFGHHRTSMKNADAGGLIVALVTKGYVRVSQYERTVSLRAGEIALYDSAQEFTVGSTAAFGLALTYVPGEVGARNSSRQEDLMARRLNGQAEGEMRELVVDVHNGSALTSRDALLNLVEHLRPTTEVRTRANLSSRNLMAELTGLISEKIIGDDFRIESIARELGVSRRTLYNHLSGMEGSLARYIKVSRLRRAAVLLAESDIPVSVVSAESGFENLSHFSRCFRAEYGMTPSQFRSRKS